MGGIAHATAEPSSQANVDLMTSRFGVLMLNHVQESHDQMSKMMTAFMAQQSEAQERFRYVDVSVRRFWHGL